MRTGLLILASVLTFGWANATVADAPNATTVTTVNGLIRTLACADLPKGTYRCQSMCYVQGNQLPFAQYYFVKAAYLLEMTGGQTLLTFEHQKLGADDQPMGLPFSTSLLVGSTGYCTFENLKDDAITVTKK